MIHLLRFVWRIFHLGLHFSKGFVHVLYLQYRAGKNWHQDSIGQKTISRWMAQLACILGLQVRVTASPLPMPALIVANHISWLDVVAIASVRPAQFVAKDNVRRWPVVGALSASSGTQFIQRNNISALRESNKRLCHSLRLRQHVAVFPEGTTTDGAGVRAFHSALFEAAREAYRPIQPLAIRYRKNGKRDSVAPYIDDDLFVVHLCKILWRNKTCVELKFLPPISSRESRRDLAVRSRELIMLSLEKEEHISAPMPVLQPLLNCAVTVK